MGMLGMVLAFGLAVVGCDDGSTSDDGGTNGLLTVTGLSAYDGKYIMVTGGDGAALMLGGFVMNNSTGAATLPLISGGKAEVKIYAYDSSNNGKDYSGSDSVGLSASIYASSTVTSGNATLAESGVKMVSFQNGKATTTFDFN
jgi:hypothetical protein